MSRADFVIVESKFGFSHPSVQTLVSNSKPPVREVVIVPYGIDIAARQALALEGGGAYYCPSGCGYSPPPTETSHYREGFRLSRRCGRCIVVGLISRLAEEKSVALFLYACAELVLHDPFYRCVIVGEGQLRGNLEDLTRRLGIAANVEFKGWVENRAIPMIVLSFDIAVTTGAWEETFSIVGLEHLGLGVPLVTFAAGGMGEYIADPHKNPSEQSLVLTFIRNLRLNCGIVNGTLPFMVSLNAIVVIRPETCALSAAIMFLNQHDSIRDRNAANGIRLVHQHFNREKFVSVYQQLLKRAVTEKYYYE
jgi:glycosyltransferase involved in cell wall biosynthesis